MYLVANFRNPRQIKALINFDKLRLTLVRVPGVKFDPRGAKRVIALITISLTLCLRVNYHITDR